MRRAQSMGLNMIIVAAIALIILFLIGFLIARSGGDLSSGLESCSAQGGMCSAGGLNVPSSYVPLSASCPEPSQICYGPPGIQ